MYQMISSPETVSLDECNIANIPLATFSNSSNINDTLNAHFSLFRRRQMKVEVMMRTQQKKFFYLEIL